MRKSPTKQRARSTRRNGRSKRRGVMVVLIAFVLVIFLVAVVFSVDVAYMQLTRAELRASTDAAARAAAEALSRTQDPNEARIAAKNIAAANTVAGDPLILGDEDIVFGSSARQPDGSWTFTAGTTPTNSVRIYGRRTQGSASGPVNLFFGSLLGRGIFEPSQFATVVRLDRDICLVVDRSSSMKLYLTDTAPVMSTSDPRFCQPPHPDLSRWAALEDAVAEFLFQLGNTPQTEYVGLVSYASNGTWCSSSNTKSTINQPVTGNHTLVTNAMTSLTNSKFNGATNISAGIDSGVVALTDPARTRPFAAKTMIVFTDGHATEGRPTIEAANDAALHDIVIHTVTFGDGANQADMQAVADATGGNYYHAPNAEALRDIFREIALTLPIVFTE